MNQYRKLQYRLMPDLMSTSMEKQHSCEVEKEPLHMPSSFSPHIRKSLGLEELAKDEMELRIGSCYDEIRAVQDCCRAVSTLKTNKRKNDSGQDRLTRAVTQINNAKFRLRLAIDHYNANRSQLEVLGYTEMDNFPPMTEADTYRKPTQGRRNVGDSRRFEGAAFAAGARTSQVRLPSDSSTAPSSSHMTGTQISRVSPSKRKVRKHAGKQYISLSAYTDEIQAVTLYLQKGSK